MGYNIICDSATRQNTREEIFAVARARGYKIIEIDIETEYSVLEQRFDERITLALQNPARRISNRSLERFKELSEIYETEKNSEAITLRSDLLTEEEILKKVLSIIS